MRLWIGIIAAAGACTTAAWALAPKSSMPDITKLHRERVNCHGAYDVLFVSAKAGQAFSKEEESFALAYEAAAEAKQPCPAVPASLSARAANRTIVQGETFNRLVKYIDANDPTAYFEAGMSAFEGKAPGVDQAGGVEFIQKAAELGDPDAMFMMARFYLGGQFGTKLDWKGALPWFEGAAKAGHVDGIFFLGQYDYDGILGKKNHKRALTYYQQAAERGHVYATYMAAWLVNSGEGGVKKDHLLAYRLARNLAEQGEPAAGAVLAASALLQQKNVKEHEDEVLYWMDLAVREGDEKVSAEVGKFRPQVVSLYKKLKAPPEYRPRPFKACGTKTVCLVNQFTRVQQCTTNKDYWSDCDG
jgi:TPR repeat protein